MTRITMSAPSKTKVAPLRTMFCQLTTDTPQIRKISSVKKAIDKRMITNPTNFFISMNNSCR